MKGDRNSILEELAERCETAVGPDRELDAEIALAARYSKGVGGKWFAHMGVGGAVDLPMFTASLDAAMTLVPEGWEPLIDYTQRNPVIVELYGEGPIGHGAAATGPLALCAAALRAQQSKDANQ